jgi:hypothetical protein
VLLFDFCYHPFKMDRAFGRHEGSARQEWAGQAEDCCRCTPRPGAPGSSITPIVSARDEFLNTPRKSLVRGGTDALHDGAVLGGCGARQSGQRGDEVRCGLAGKAVTAG